MSGSPKTAMETFLLSIEQMGIEATTTVLQQQIEREAWLRNPDVLFVLEMVSVALKIPPEEIRKGVTRKNERRDAIGFCAFYLNDKLGYSMEQVSWMLNRSFDICCKYARLIRKLDHRRIGDKKYLQWRALFDKKIEKHKLSVQPEKIINNGRDTQPDAPLLTGQ